MIQDQPSEKISVSGEEGVDDQAHQLPEILVLLFLLVNLGIRNHKKTQAFRVLLHSKTLHDLAMVLFSSSK